MRTYAAMGRREDALGEAILVYQICYVIHARIGTPKTAEQLRLARGNFDEFDQLSDDLDDKLAGFGAAAEKELSPAWDRAEGKDEEARERLPEEEE
jgi:hypothetical protein